LVEPKDERERFNKSFDKLSGIFFFFFFGVCLLPLLQMLPTGVRDRKVVVGG
jgi:hypothetical protein